MKSFNKVFAASLALLISLPAMGMQSVSNSSLVKAAGDHPFYAAGILGAGALGIGAAYLRYQGKLGSTVKAVQDAATSKQANRIHAYAAGAVFPIATGAAIKRAVSASGSYWPYTTVFGIATWVLATPKAMNWYARAMALDAAQKPDHTRDGKNRKRMGNAATLTVLAAAGGTGINMLIESSKRK